MRELGVLALVLLLAGCTAASPGQAARPATPEPTAAVATPLPSPLPTPSVQVPVYRAAAPAARVPVPPVRVVASSVDVDVPVEPVGVREDSLMELPDYVGTAGWYRYGADPTTGSGTTVLAAHVDSLKWGLGPFARLKGLAQGAEIIVTTADGAEHRYTVQSVANVLKADLPVAEIFTRTGEERLVLITCGGQFDREALRYSDNVLVTAVPAD